MIGVNNCTLPDKNKKLLSSNIEQRFKGRGGGECDFPEWMQGKWEHVHVDGGTMLLKDTRNFKTYTAKCVGQANPVAHSEDRERFLVYARTQCGDEHYKCVWLKDRGDNALEMQIGEFRKALFYGKAKHLCSRFYFNSTADRRCIQCPFNDMTLDALTISC